jgi:hypothetical protein
MNKLLIGAVALSLIGGSAAFAQDYNSDQGHRDGSYQAGRDQGGRDHQDGGYHNNRTNGDHRGHSVCSWRHHHRSCYR